MKLKDFTITIIVDESPGEVFDAINDVRGWWTGEPGVEGKTKEIGDEFTYRYKDIHYSKQRIIESVPGKKIVWLVTDSSLNFIETKSEWTGTRISFEITDIKGRSEVKFTHMGLTSNIECYKDCSNAWSSYIQDSLQKFIAGEKIK